MDKAALYPVKVVFKRTFAKGSLKGLTIDDSLRFVNEASALRWMAGVKVNCKEIHAATLTR